VKTSVKIRTWIEEGLWDSTWVFGGNSGAGQFTVEAKFNPDNHGHVKRVGSFLEYDDGSSFYYRGANWLETRRLYPGFEGYFKTEDLLRYFDRLKETNHNGTTIMNMDRVRGKEGNESIFHSLENTGSGSQAVCTYELENERWVQKQDISSKSMPGVIYAYDPVSKKLIHRGRQYTYAYTPETDSYEALHRNSASWWGSRNAAMEPEARSMVVIGSGNFSVSIFK